MNEEFLDYAEMMDGVVIVPGVMRYPPYDFFDPQEVEAAAQGIARSVGDWEPDDGAYDLARAALDGLKVGGFLVVKESVDE